MRSDASKSFLVRILRFFTSRQFFIVTFSVIALAVGLTLYSNFRTEQVDVNPKDKTTPQYPYRKDELALLQIALNDLMESESQKRYEQIYTDMASRRFQRRVPQRIFMKMTNCVEQYLGDMISYDRNNNGFRRERRKGRLVDVLQLHVERAETAIEEQIVFEWDGVDVKVGGLYWMTDRRAFHDCVREVRVQKQTLEEAGAMEAAPESSEKQSTEIQGDSKETEQKTDTATPESTTTSAPAATSPKTSTGKPKSDDPDLNEKETPENTTTLQKEAGETNAITDFGSPPSEQPGESSKPAE